MGAGQLTTFQRWSILAGAAVLLSLAMGMRQSFGLFQPSIIRDVGITVAESAPGVPTVGTITPEQVRDHLVRTAVALATG